MVKVSFITKDNDVYEMSYAEVLEFCKEICLRDEIKDEFNQFKRNYTIFDPYFDFVTFRLEYIFCVGGFQLIHYKNPDTGDEGLYDAVSKSLDYKEILASLYKMINLHIDNFPVIKIAKCSDRDLNIEVLNNIPSSSFLVDGNSMGLISKAGDPRGSHPLTANTILNQYLIHDEDILSTLINYKNFNGFSDGTGLNFLEEVLGYMRVTKNSLVYNGIVVSLKQRKLIEEAIDADYIVEDKDIDIKYHNTEPYLK